MRPLLVLALLAAGTAAGAQVRPMPAYDDDSSPRGGWHVDTATSTVGMHDEAERRAERTADRACAGPRGGARALARCRDRRLTEERRARAAEAADAGYGERAADLQARFAACQAGDPDACY